MYMTLSPYKDNKNIEEMQEINGFLKINETCFNTQSTYFRTRQVMDGDREVIHKKGHVSLLYRLIINMIS